RRKKRGRKIDALRDVSERHKRSKMSKNNPQRNAWGVCNSQPPSDHNEFAAISHGNRWRERPSIKKYGHKEYCHRTQSLDSTPTNRPNTDFAIRLCLWIRSHHLCLLFVGLRVLRKPASHCLSSRKLAFLQTMIRTPSIPI